MNIKGHKVEYPENIQTPKDVFVWFMRQVDPVPLDEGKSVLIDVAEELHPAMDNKDVGSVITDAIRRASTEFALTIHNFLSIYGTKNIGVGEFPQACDATYGMKAHMRLKLRISAPDPEQVDIAA